MKKITEKEIKVLNAIKIYIENENIPPTIREICKLSGFSSSSTVHKYFRTLKAKGYITYRLGTYRSVSVLNKTH